VCLCAKIKKPPMADAMNPMNPMNPMFAMTMMLQQQVQSLQKQLSKKSSPHDGSNHNQVCRFWLEGRCMNGDSCPYRHSVDPETPSPAAVQNDKPQQQAHNSTPAAETGKTVLHGRRPREPLLSAPLPAEEPAKKWTGKRRGSSPVKQERHMAQENVEKPVITPPPAPVQVISPEEAEARRRRLEKYSKPLPLSRRRTLAESHDDNSVKSEPPVKKQAVQSNQNSSPTPAPAPVEVKAEPKQASQTNQNTLPAPAPGPVEVKTEPNPSATTENVKTESESKPPAEADEELDEALLDDVEFSGDIGELDDVEGLLDD